MMGGGELIDLAELMQEVEKRNNQPVIEKVKSPWNHKKWDWWLSYLARAYTRAKRLEKLRESFHADLYECVQVPSMPLDPIHRPNNGNPATNAQAFRIIAKKERYERKIEKEYQLHETWKKILQEYATKKEEIILIRYFQKRRSIKTDIIASILEGMDRQLTLLEQQIERERAKKARELMIQYDDRRDAAIF